MKKKVKITGYILSALLLISIVLVYLKDAPNEDSSPSSRGVASAAEQPTKKASEIKEDALPLVSKDRDPKQLVNSRPTSHNAERIHKNRAMPYRLQREEGVDFTKINVVRWPKDRNDLWRDSAGKGFPIDDSDRLSRKATIRDNPEGDLKYIVKYARRGAFIGKPNGEKAFEVPLRRKIDEKVYQVQDWVWLDNRTLVGVMAHDLDQNDHVEYGDTRIHLFKIEDNLESGRLVEVSTPFVPHRSTIRIEGITSDGGVVLSRVYDGSSDGVKFDYLARNYSKSGHEPEKFLGVFKIKKTSP